MGKPALVPETSILVIEDRNSDAELVRSYLEDFGTGKFRIEHAADLASALPMLATRNVDAVMLDLFLPDTAELDGLKSIQSVKPNLPVLILTGRDDEDLAFKAVEKGAQDYLLKEKLNPGMLKRSIFYAIQRQRCADAVMRQAHFDTLTGLPNRDLFMQRLEAAFARHLRLNRRLGLMMLDLDGFKAVNDGYGHESGDAVLREVGHRIPHCLRPYDTAARLGGDEFVVLVEDVKRESDYAAVARKLIEQIEPPIIVGSRTLKVGVSIGIAESEGTAAVGSNSAGLLRRADAAMYEAKKERGSAFRFAA